MIFFVLPLSRKRLTPHWSFSFLFLETHPELYDYTGAGKKKKKTKKTYFFVLPVNLSVCLISCLLHCILLGLGVPQ